MIVHTLTRLPGVMLRRAKRAARGAVRMTHDPAYRHVHLRVPGRKPTQWFQQDNSTCFDRFPELFAPHWSLMRQRPTSFRSVVRLGRRFSPFAAIFPMRKSGASNPGNIAQCNRDPRARGDEGLDFICKGNLRDEPTDHYSAIFCNAVIVDSYLRAKFPEVCTPHLRFEDFAVLVGEFRRCLIPGGILMLRFSSFRLADAPDGGAFELLTSMPLPEGKEQPLYGPDNRLVRGAVAEEAIFRRVL